MANGDYRGHPISDIEFIESSQLYTLVPQTSGLDPEELLKNVLEVPEGDSTAVSFSTLPQRKLLFFDESLTVHVILRTNALYEADLESYISRIAVNLDVFVVGNSIRPSQAQADAGEEHPPIRELIASIKVDESDEPVIAFQNDQKDAEEITNAYILWPLRVSLARPKARLLSPFLAFSATAKLNKGKHYGPKLAQDEYLASLSLSGTNLLESFANDPTITGKPPKLSSLQVSHINVADPNLNQSLRPLRNESKHLIPIVSATSSRARMLKLDWDLQHRSMICALDFSVSPHANCDISLESIELQLENGTVAALASPQELGGLPLVCKPQDEISFIYRLFAASDSEDEEVTSAITRLDIAISTTALISDTTRPQILTRWSTNIEFSPKPSPLSVPSRMSSQNVARQQERVSMKPDSLPSLQSPSMDPDKETALGLGVTLTVTVAKDVLVGEEFTWDIHIVNDSPKPRKFAIVAIPRRRRTDLKKIHPRPTSGSLRKIEDIADPVIDENIIYAMQKSTYIEPTEVICLSTDIRIGALPPKTSNVTKIRFVAMTTGVLHIEALRIVDLSSQETIDIRDLPTIVSKRRDDVDTDLG